MALQPSPLHSCHLALGARLAPFAGWELPVQYEGVAAEHRSVREGCGVFDISHMGQLFVEGEGATAWLNRQLSNDLDRLRPGQGHYTLMLDERGGVIDDLLAYRLAPERYLLVVNAARIAEDLAWLDSRLPGGTPIDLCDRSRDYAAIAAQGPGSAALWGSVEPAWSLPPRNAVAFRRGGDELLCRTGYTGEDGCELFVPAAEGPVWWERLLAAGAKPCGLAARDSLRLEKCFPLYGADLDLDHTPLEAGLSRFVAMDKAGGFTGREALARQREEGLPTRLCAIRALAKGPPPRSGYPIVAANDDPTKTHTTPESPPLARLSSGRHSPSLGLGIGLAYLPAASSAIGTRLDLIVRERAYPVEIVAKPFV